MKARADARTPNPRHARRPRPISTSPPTRRSLELGPPVTTADFAAIARACARGRDDLVSRGHDVEGVKRLRPFSTWEITRYLIPVAPAHFRRVLRANPELPQGRAETEGGAKWFTLDEVLRLRAHFAAEGSRAKEYRPYRPPGLPAKVAAIANFKGGVGKTSTAAHLAMSAALDGYRVLVIDLDSQGSMTSIFGGRVAERMGHGVPADRARLRARAPGREPPPGRARRHPAAARGRARDALERKARDVIQADPLAEHRPRRRPAQPLLGRVPDPGLAHGPARLEALGRADPRARPRPGARRATTSSSSTRPRHSATSPSTA